MGRTMNEYTIHPEAEATVKQIGFVHVCIRKHGWTDDMRRGCIREMFGENRDLDNLTRLEMSQLIDRIITGPLWVDPRQGRLPL
jgi:hypothetical protein